MRRFHVRGRLWIHGFGSVEVGSGTDFGGGRTGIDLHTGPGARIVIGAQCSFGEGACIEACDLVKLGDRVVVGARAKILDNNFHSLRGNPNDRPQSKMVVIEDDVVIGSRAIILPGVHIGRGARIADDAVVHRLVPAGRVVAGNPARNVSAA